MTKLLYWSDLHTEYGDFSLPEITLDIDAVLLGGDTGVGDSHLDFLKTIYDKYQVPVYSIRGNHEYYHQIWEDQIEKDEKRLLQWKKEGIPIDVLHRKTIVVNDVRIIGASLWTDMMYRGDQGVFSIPAAEANIADYKAIQIRDSSTGKPRVLKARDTMMEHLLDKEYIFNSLKTSFSGKTIVMTHHLPSSLCVHSQFKDSPYNPAFVSEMTEEILRTPVDIWLYGHSHKKNDNQIEKYNGEPLQFIANPKGYSHESRTTGFKKDFILKL